MKTWPPMPPPSSPHTHTPHPPHVSRFFMPLSVRGLQWTLELRWINISNRITFLRPVFCPSSPKGVSPGCWMRAETQSLDLWWMDQISLSLHSESWESCHSVKFGSLNITFTHFTIHPLSNQPRRSLTFFTCEEVNILKSNACFFCCSPACETDCRSHSFKICWWALIKKDQTVWVWHWCGIPVFYDLSQWAVLMTTQEKGVQALLWHLRQALIEPPYWSTRLSLLLTTLRQIFCHKSPL